MYITVPTALPWRDCRVWRTGTFSGQRSVRNLRPSEAAGALPGAGVPSLLAARGVAHTREAAFGAVGV